MLRLFPVDWFCGLKPILGWTSHADAGFPYLRTFYACPDTHCLVAASLPLSDAKGCLMSGPSISVSLSVLLIRRRSSADHRVALSLIPIIPLLLTLLPHALPSRLTSLSPISRAGPIGVSLICLEIIRAGKTLLSQQILEGSRRDGGSPAVILMCEVDTVM